MYIGIDIGGTNLKIGVLNDQNELVYQHSQATNATKGIDYVLNTLKRLIYNSIEKYPGIESIGIGIPGIIKPDGTVQFSPNLPGWVDYPLGKYLKNTFSQPIFIDNDANVATAAEMELGAAKNESHFIYLTLGTGVGGSIVLDRKIYKGQFNGAGEIGHLIIDANEATRTTNPYRTGVLEEFVGRNHITAFAANVIKKYPKSILHKYDRPDPYFVSEAAAQNDEAALEIFRMVGYYFGIGITSVMNLLDIRLAIVGGGISQAHDLFLETALETIKLRALPTIAPYAELRKAHFTKDAGIIGAALMGKLLL